MVNEKFAHLHVHTEYSTLDSTVRIPALMKKAVDFGMPAVAITDHGNMYGVVEFFQEATKAGIKPIIGCEVYMARGKIADRQDEDWRNGLYHFTLLAKDETGYHNLVKLVSIAQLDGMFYKPRIDKEVLAKYSKGLIGLSGCLKGEINRHIQADEMPKARQSAADFRDIFGKENFFLEMHDHGIEAQRKCNSVLPLLAKEFGIGLVATNDVHLLERSHHEAQDVLIRIGTGACITDEKRMHYAPELYFKSPEEMQLLFREHPEAVTNTLHIVEMCDFQMKFGEPRYPTCAVPAVFINEEYVRQKYGEHSVAKPATFGTMGAESVVRDVGRVMGLSYRDGDRIAKMIPDELGITLKAAAQTNLELKQAVETEPVARQLWNYATTLEGLVRNVGVHASVVVIGDRDLSEYIPLTRGNAKDVVSQYAMGPLIDLGVSKMDHRALSALTRAIRDSEQKKYE